MTRRNTAVDYILMEFFVTGIVASLYLLVFDSALQTLAPLHWAILLGYIVASAILFTVSVASGKRYAYLGLGTISALLVIAMMADAAFGLPLSKAHVAGVPGLGWNYLFGFGAPGTSSLFAVSFSFTLMLVSLIVVAAMSFIRYRR